MEQHVSDETGVPLPRQFVGGGLSEEINLQRRVGRRQIVGIVLGFGVGMALLLAMTLVPLFFSILPKPKAWRTGTTGRVQDLLDPPWGTPQPFPPVGHGPWF